MEERRSRSGRTDGEPWEGDEAVRADYRALRQGQPLPTRLSAVLELCLKAWRKTDLTKWIPDRERLYDHRTEGRPGRLGLAGALVKERIDGRLEHLIEDECGSDARALKAADHALHGEWIEAWTACRMLRMTRIRSEVLGTADTGEEDESAEADCEAMLRAEQGGTGWSRWNRLTKRLARLPWPAETEEGEGPEHWREALQRIRGAIPVLERLEDEHLGTGDTDGRAGRAELLRGR